jgi:predicted RNase H-like nuclease (RuvC/YqgF family)
MESSVSDSERPDLAAYHELEQLIHALGDEMAAWRRRAHEAEARLKEVAPGALKNIGIGPSHEALERENRELRHRVDAAKKRTKQLLERMRFLRQQHEAGAGR